MKYIVFASRILFWVIIAAPFWIYGQSSEGLSKLLGEDAILGVWLTEKQDSKIKIVKDSNNIFYGKLIWVEAPNQDYTGKAILKNVSYNPSTGIYNCPWVYDPKLNITVRATATVANDTLYLKARKGFITKMEKFIRVKDK
jgi:hypothetical protein